MNKQQIKNLDLTLALTLQMQSVIHTIDELSHDVKYKREFKQRCDNFYSWLEKHVEPMTANLPEDTINRWVDIVAELDAIVNKIKIFADEE